MIGLLGGAGAWLLGLRSSISISGILGFLNTLPGHVLILAVTFFLGSWSGSRDERQAWEAKILRGDLATKAMETRIEAEARRLAAERIAADMPKLKEQLRRLAEYEKAEDSCVANDRDLDFFGGLRGPRLIPGWRPATPGR